MILQWRRFNFLYLSLQQEMAEMLLPEQSKDTAKLHVLSTLKSRLLSYSFKGHCSLNSELTVLKLH